MLLIWLLMCWLGWLGVFRVGGSCCCGGLGWGVFFDGDEVVLLC